MISIGDDYVIETDRGERVFRLDGKALRIRKTILFEDMDGRELCKIQERMLRVRDSMEIEGPDGNRGTCVSASEIVTRSTSWSATGSARRSPWQKSAPGTLALATASIFAEPSTPITEWPLAAR